MSVLRPAAKIQKLETQTPIRRTESVDLSVSVAEAKDHRTVSPLTQTTKEMKIPSQTPTHPKGHKVRNVCDVWTNMDSQSFLHLSDTLTLGDVWIQPISAAPERGAFVSVLMKQILYAPHIKSREATTKMSTDDLLKMLYMCDCTLWKLDGAPVIAFEEWLNEKTAMCVKVKGIEEGSDRTKLCNFILCDDPSFKFTSTVGGGRFSVWFRKICYHSYKQSEEGVSEKIINPSMIKCTATKGSFEYILEARLLEFPVEETDASLI